MLRGGGGAAGLTNAANVSITGGQISGVSGVPVKLAQWGVPVGVAPTGSMGNNGAVTLGTALDFTYSGGIWLLYPASAVAAGVPASASFLWTVMSSTTVGVVYNSTFDGLSVPAVGVTTAYVTTGPGAFAGVTAATVAITIPVAANTLGINGTITGDWAYQHNSAAGNKTIEVFYSTTGGTNYGIIGSTQGNGAHARTVIRNQGVTNVQEGRTNSFYDSSLIGSNNKHGAADTTASTTIVYRLTNATATNWVVIEGGSFVTLQ